MATPIFDWSEYLRLANQLAASPDEASQRSSISRAYYCIYHKASERAVSTGCVDQRNHRKLWNVYAGNTDRICRKLFDIGSRMKLEREVADYTPTAPRIPDRMNDQLRRANKFMNLLSALAPGLPAPKFGL